MTDRHIDDEALGWAIRMAEPDADWNAFLAWLEGDAVRSERYDDAVAMLDEARMPSQSRLHLRSWPERRSNSLSSRRPARRVGAGSAERSRLP